ncbi:MAG: phosphate ABC transporter substrate-binding protein PstS [Actinomycetota bacterium]|nr:phosphate ABC transporter substrate-binding protein PstS [Actinomycetota bacterium]
MKLSRSTRLAAALAAGSLALAACGGSDGGGASATEDEGLGGTLAGAGSSAQAAAMEGWIAGFQTVNEQATVNYDPVGSGGGREQFLAGGVAFAGSDAALDEEELAQAEERCGEGGLVEVPLYISPIAVAFNLPGIETLDLSPEVIAGIFAQKITTWDAPEIAADNPDADLPSTAITPVNRADESGTTENFTEYLAAAAPQMWTEEPSGDWPIAGGEAAQGTSGVVQAIEGAEGAIGYADASQVGDLGIVAVGVGDEFVEYSPEAAAAVVENSPRIEGRPEGSLALELARDTAESGNYPIVLVSYQLACKTYEDTAQGELVRGFLEYAASEEGQAAASEAAGSTPISDTIRTEALAQIEQIGA